MPKAFDDCVRNGGKVKRKNLKNGKYVNVCYDKHGSHSDGVKKIKEDVVEHKVLLDSLLQLKKHYDDNYRS